MYSTLPILSFVKKKYFRCKSNLLPPSFTLLLYTLPAYNAIIYLAGANYKAFIDSTRPLITGGDKKLAVKARSYYFSFLYYTGYSNLYLKITIYYIYLLSFNLLHRLHY